MQIMVLAEAHRAEKDPPAILVKVNSDVLGLRLTVIDYITEYRIAPVRAIGASALYTAFKGIVKAREQLSSQGLEIVVRPGFATVKGAKGDTLTAIVLTCFAAQVIEPTNCEACESISVFPGTDIWHVANDVKQSISNSRYAAVRAVGAGAVNQALKGIIQARQFWGAQGQDLIARFGEVWEQGSTEKLVRVMALNCSFL